MINRLLEHFISPLFPGADAFGNSVTFVLGVPIVAGSIGLQAGPMKVNLQTADLTSSEPRPQPIRQSFSGSPLTIGPYSLAKSPLGGKVLAKLVTNPDERKTLLFEGQDYTYDDQNNELTLSGNLDLSNAIELILEYSFVGIFSTREFEQEFTLEAVESTAKEAEALASLSATILLTNHDQTLEILNLNPMDYNIGIYQSVHTFIHYQWIGGEPLPAIKDPYHYRLYFQVRGMIKTIKGDPGSYGIIESVRSPGTTIITGQPVNIEPELG